MSERNSIIVHGRSDATLNRNGVRMGSAEIYLALEKLPQIADSLVVGVELPGGDYWMPLFVVLHEGAMLDDKLRTDILQTIRHAASPRHLPDAIIELPAIPRTLTGKKLEIPVKRILLGQRPEQVVDLGAVDRPDVLADLAQLALAGGQL
jgi:acetoacetyl-CoA synthetase